MSANCIRHRVLYSTDAVDYVNIHKYAGVELDVRFNTGRSELVVAHDRQQVNIAQGLREYLTYVNMRTERCTFVIDVKENGLFNDLSEVLRDLPISVKIMGVPGMELPDYWRLKVEHGIDILSRVSEYERQYSPFGSYLLDSFDNNPERIMGLCTDAKAEDSMVIGYDLRGAQAFKNPLLSADGIAIITKLHPGVVT